MQLSFIMALCAASGTMPAQCAQTPLLAVQSAVSSSGASSHEGYRATEAVVDARSGRMWIRVVTCNHPERPASLVPLSVPVVSLGTPSAAVLATGTVSTGLTGNAVAVRPGETIRLRFSNTDAHVVLQAKAEDQGVMGQTINVRMPSLMGDNSEPRRIKAVITGPGEAMVQPQ